jgi:hypothetical protein
MAFSFMLETIPRACGLGSVYVPLVFRSFGVEAHPSEQFIHRTFLPLSVTVTSKMLNFCWSQLST